MSTRFYVIRGWPSCENVLPSSATVKLELSIIPEEFSARNNS